MNFRKILLSTFFVHLFFAVNAKITFQPHVIRIIANDPSIVPWNGNRSTDAVFDQLLRDFEVAHIDRPMQFAKTVALQNCFEIYTPLDADLLGKALVSYNSIHGKLLSVERIPEIKNLDVPNDYFWYVTTETDYMWYLQKIQAEQAWGITHGDPNVKVAVIDQGIDMNHPEMIGKIDPLYDFYTGLPFTTDPGLQSHGTSVSSLIAAETTPVGVPNNGAMPSIGWDTKIMFSSSLNAPLEYFPDPNPNITYSYSRGDLMVLYASTVMEAKVVNISWYAYEYGDDAYQLYMSEYPQGIASYLLVEKEILDNGTSIVRAAGNDHWSVFSDGTQNRLYPFSGYEDHRTLVVSSAGPEDKHVHYFGQQAYTNSHYPEVDLCAPGYSLLCATSTSNGQSPWPYASYGGTSQSTPLVVGTIALMHAVNPCLGAGMAHDIIKATTDAVVDAADFPGAVGTGRLNSYEAVLAAQNAISQTLDLFIKDRPEDLGNEMYPYHWQAPRDESPDIWVRNQPDGFTNTINQEPEYNSGNPVYVYVRVHNKSCVTSTGNETVRLYWTKASSMTSWPENWDGSQPTIGNVVGTVPIPVLEPGEETVLQFYLEHSESKYLQQLGKLFNGPH